MIVSNEIGKGDSSVDRDRLREEFLYALATDLLSPVVQRLRGRRRRDFSASLLLKRTASKELIRKRSGTRRGDEWYFDRQVLKTDFVNIATLIAGLNCRFDDYDGIASALVAYQRAMEVLLEQLDDSSGLSDPPDDFDLFVALVMTHESIRVKNIDPSRWSDLKKLGFMDVLVSHAERLSVNLPEEVEPSLDYFTRLESRTAYWRTAILTIDGAVCIGDWFLQDRVTAGVPS